MASPSAIDAKVDRLLERAGDLNTAVAVLGRDVEVIDSAVRDARREAERLVADLRADTERALAPLEARISALEAARDEARQSREDTARRLHELANASVPAPVEAPPAPAREPLVPHGSSWGLAWRRAAEGPLGPYLIPGLVLIVALVASIAAVVAGVPVPGVPLAADDDDGGTHNDDGDGGSDAIGGF